MIIFFLYLQRLVFFSHSLLATSSPHFTSNAIRSSSFHVDIEYFIHLIQPSSTASHLLHKAGIKFFFSNLYHLVQSLSSLQRSPPERKDIFSLILCPVYFPLISVLSSIMAVSIVQLFKSYFLRSPTATISLPLSNARPQSPLLPLYKVIKYLEIERSWNIRKSSNSALSYWVFNCQLKKCMNMCHIILKK